MSRTILTSLVALMFLMMLTSCVVYSGQDYGSQAAKSTGLIERGESVDRVLLSMGAPDILFTHDKCDALVYKLREGKTILGPIFTTAKRTDVVVVIDKNGRVIEKGTVDRGEGMTVLGVLDTVPISVDAGGGGMFGMRGAGGSGALLAGPDNYGTKK